MNRASVLSSSLKEIIRMQPWIMRLAIVACLVFASGFGGGWKWELIPH
jgi:hypothetical protein